jgi:hypothetical protein
MVANRVRPRSVAGARLDAFLAGLAHPTVARLSESQLYAGAATAGRGLADLPATRTRRLVGEWTSLLAYVNDVITTR